MVEWITHFNNPDVQVGIRRDGTQDTDIVLSFKTITPDEKEARVHASVPLQMILHIVSLLYPNMKFKGF